VLFALPGLSFVCFAVKIFKAFDRKVREGIAKIADKSQALRELL